MIHDSGTIWVVKPSVLSSPFLDARQSTITPRTIKQSYATIRRIYQERLLEQG